MHNPHPPFSPLGMSRHNATLQEHILFMLEQSKLSRQSVKLLHLAGNVNGANSPLYFSQASPHCSVPAGSLEASTWTETSGPREETSCDDFFV